MARLAALLAGLALLPGAASAHPHIFIDTGLRLGFDAQGRLASVRVIWSYDDLYSLLTFEDLGLDPDADGTLTDDELARLNGFDMAWIEGYDGDLKVNVGDMPLTLTGPLEWTTRVEQGRIVTMHTRAFETPVEVGSGGVSFRIYDPGFYTAYTVVLDTAIEGRAGCTAQLWRPDLTEANQQLLDALAELGATESVEDAGFPAVGAAFADEIRLTCAPPS